MPRKYSAYPEKVPDLLHDSRSFVWLHEGRERSQGLPHAHAGPVGMAARSTGPLQQHGVCGSFLKQLLPQLPAHAPCASNDNWACGSHCHLGWSCEQPIVASACVPQPHTSAATSKPQNLPAEAMLNQQTQDKGLVGSGQASLAAACPVEGKV